MWPSAIVSGKLGNWEAYDISIMFVSSCSGPVIFLACLIILQKLSDLR